MASSSSIKVDGLLSMVTIRLCDNNFLKWSFQLESVLQGYELFGHFDGSIVQPPKFTILEEEGVTSQVTAGYKEWLKIDKALLSLLIATLSDEALEYVIGTKMARDAWLNLVDRYASVSRARINHLKTELQTAQKGGDSIERFLLRLKHVRDQLAQAGVKVSDDDFMIATLNGLPPEYDMIKTVLIARDSSISLKDFRAQLLAAEQTAEARLLTHSAMLTSHHPSSGYHSLASSSTGYAPMSPSLSTGTGILSTPPGSTVAFYASNAHNRYPGPRGMSGSSGGSNGFGRGKYSNGGFGKPVYTSSPLSGSQVSGSNLGSNSFHKSKSVPECQICCKRGHTAVNCYFRHDASSAQGSAQVIECQICGKRGHGALDCFQRSNYSYQGQPPSSKLSAMTAQSSYMPNQVWIADSGASHHMVADVSSLHQVTPCDSAEQVTVGNGEGLEIQNIGTTSLSCNSSSLHMPSVFHVLLL